MEKVNSVSLKKKKVSTITLVKVALLAGIAYALMFLEMPVPLFPGFLKIDLSDMPALVAGLALGPVAGFAVEAVKNFLHLITATSTGGVGEIANIVVGSSFVVVASIVYKKDKTLKNLIKGFALGTIAMVVIGTAMNYFIMLPFYGKIMGLEAIIGMGTAINPNVKDLLSFVFWFIAPFNLIKGVLISIITIPLYKKIEKLIKNNLS
nr:ECF transporter S component [uncultured Peptostreptococcus sp.]